MSGRVPPSSRARGRVSVRRASQSELKKGSELFESFTGRKAKAIGIVELPEVSEIGLRIGTLDGVLYTTIRDGRRERFVHQFKAGDRPWLVVSPDGGQIFIIGGNYDFTERGIVDGSDAKTRSELGMNPLRARVRRR